MGNINKIRTATEMRMTKSTLSLVFLSIYVVSVHAEVMLYNAVDIPLSTPIEVVLPEKAILDADYAAGKVTVSICVSAERNAWTVYSQDKPVMLSNSKQEFKTVSLPQWEHYGCIGSGRVLALDFPLPDNRDPDDPLKLTIGKGICSWEKPDGRFDIEIWTGPRLFGQVWIDRMNRNCIVILNDLGDIVQEYRYEFPDGILTTRRNTCRHRLQGDAPFDINIAAVLKGGSELKARLKAIPHETTTPQPLKDGEILVGLCVYVETEEKRISDHPDGFVLYQRDRHEEMQLLIKEAGVNLIVPWFNPKIEHVGAAAEKGIYTMTIYQHCSEADNSAYIKAGKHRNWLNNNIGEYASYLYQGEDSAKACNINTTGNLMDCREFFINEFIRRGVQNYHRTYPYIFSTSGSTLGCYEMAGGIDFILCELYALGAQNLAWSSAEMRGAARKWKPEFWGGWLAAEWQSCQIPYKAPQKYDMLKVGLYQQYLMGSHIIILESGSQSTQAGEHTAPSDSKYPKRNYNSTEAPVKSYKEEMTEFYKFVKANPRSKGTPETRMAMALGNCGGFVGLYIDWFAVFGQHAQARDNSNWLYGDPERTDVAVQDVIFPRPSDALGEYPNQWIGGSPFGQCDIVNIDEETRVSDIARYPFIFYGGWNTMTEEIMGTLRSYVEKGGTLFISLPHFSTRLDREHKTYGVNDLINDGDLSQLLDVKITQCRTGVGSLSGKEFQLNGMVENEPLADIEGGPAVETMIAAGECPFLIRQKIGNGTVYMLLTWEYPGKTSLAQYYKQILAGLARKFIGDVRITSVNNDDKAIEYIAYAIWPEAIYLLNTDCMNERTFILESMNGKDIITLKPTEFVVIPR
ncbi:MAG: hypothetical protein RBT80_27670 [Candidatus Vecturithrix sp.]|jgi:hypothetical protein|nr:hypothetical protein [Candidatus Vecturithrix sp.]